jgi:hypothetical protein
MNALVISVSLHLGLARTDAVIEQVKLPSLPTSSVAQPTHARLVVKALGSTIPESVLPGAEATIE